MDSSEEALSKDLGVILKYIAEPVASSSSNESLGAVDDEEALHERLLGYETMKI